LPAKKRKRFKKIWGRECVKEENSVSNPLKGGIIGPKRAVRAGKVDG